MADPETISVNTLIVSANPTCDAVAMPAPDLVFRTTRMARAGAAAVGMFIGGIGLSILTGAMQSEPGGTAGKFYALVMIVGAIVVPWRLAFHPRVILTERAVTVVNPVRKTTIPLDRVAPHGGAAYTGLKIFGVVDGQVVTVAAWAVQKSNLAVWLSRDTRADRIREAIEQAASAVQSSSPLEPE